MTEYRVEEGMLDPRDKERIGWRTFGVFPDRETALEHLKVFNHAGRIARALEVRTIKTVGLRP